MTETKRKRLYWSLKILSIIVSCALPIWAVCEKFPLWQTEHGTTHSIGVGIILVGVVLLVVFRRTVFHFIRDKLDIKHAPPLTIWVVFLIIAYIMMFLGNFMTDMTTILWAGFIGCCIGTILTYFAERTKGKGDE